MVGSCGRKRRMWARAAGEGWCVGVVSACNVDGVSVRGVAGTSCVGMDDGVGFCVKYVIIIHCLLDQYSIIESNQKNSWLL